MSQVLNWVHQADKKMAAHRFLNEKSLMGKLLGVGETPDTFLKTTTEYLDGRKNIAETKLLRFIPARIRPFLAAGFTRFNALPGFNRLSAALKWPLMFQAVGSVFTTLGDIVTGFRQTEGGIVRKTINGIVSGVKSALKSMGVFAASAWVAMKVPTMLGISALGPMGILITTIASGIAASLTQKAADSVVDTHAHTQKEPPILAGYNTPMLQSDNPYVRNIEKMWLSQSHLPQTTQTNPFGNYMQ